MFPLYYLYLFLFSCNYLLLELDGVVVYLNLLCFSFIVFNFTYFSLCMSENVYIWIWVVFFKRYSFFHINIFDICMCMYVLYVAFSDVAFILRNISPYYLFFLLNLTTLNVYGELLFCLLLYVCIFYLLFFIYKNWV